MIKVDGQQIAHRIKEEISMLLKKTGPKSLAIFYVGENSVIDSYVALKKRRGTELGIKVDVMRYRDQVTTSEVISHIQEAAKQYAGIIVQLPLPEYLDTESILNAVPTSLDVDVLSAQGYENFKTGQTQKLPPVVAAIQEIVTTHRIDLRDKNIVIIGRGRLVGAPVSAWLTREGFSFYVLDKEDTQGLSLLKDADVIISGAGVPSLVTADMIKSNAVLIDAGTSTAHGKIQGDIDPSCYEQASIVSPVPGGVGPITVVSLFRNLFLP